MSNNAKEVEEVHEDAPEDDENNSESDDQQEGEEESESEEDDESVDNEHPTMYDLMTGKYVSCIFSLVVYLSVL